MIKFKLLLFLIFILNVVYGQFTLISTEGPATAYLLNNNTKFEGYPGQSESNKCSFNFKILLYNTNNDGQPILYSGVILGQTVISFTDDDKIDLNTFTKYIKVESINYGQLNANINFTINSITTTYKLTYLCKEINLNLLNLKFLTDKPSFEILFFVSMLSFDKSIGRIDSYFRVDPPTCSFSISDDLNNYMIYWDLNYVKNNINNNLTITISNGDSKSIILETRSYYYDLLPLPQAFDFKYYPSEVQENYNGFIYEQFGYGSNPIYTTRILTNDTRPLQMQTINGNQLVLGYPLKGRKGDMIYTNKLFKLFPIISVPSIVTLTSQAGIGITEFNVTTIINYSEIVPAFSSSTMIINSYGSYFSASVDCPTGYKHTKIIQNFNGNELITDFPFGFHSGTNSNFKFEVIYFKNDQGSTTVNLIFKIQNQLPPDTGKYESVNSTLIMQSNYPKITNYEFKRITQTNKVLLKIRVTSYNGISSIFTKSKIGFETLVSGDRFNGEYELVLDHTQYPFGIVLTDSIDLSYSYKIGDFISFDNSTKKIITFEPPSYFNYKISYDQFSNITFGNNDLNLVNQSSYNIAYLQSDSLPIDIPLSLILYGPINSPYIDQEIFLDVYSKDFEFPFQYDENLKLFTCKFIVPKNNLFDEIQYGFISKDTVIFGGQLPKSTRLRVKDTYLDNQGPIIKKLSKIGDGYSISSSATIGWQIEITDDYNGFESGYIKVIGTLDNSVYQFNFTINDAIPGSTLWDCTFQIMINITSPCYAQSLLISQVILYDTNKIKSEFNLYSEAQSLKNPFINFYGNSSSLDITKIVYSCALSQSESKTPTLSDFKVSSSFIDVGVKNRSITFQFTLSLEAISLSIGLKNDQTPSVYLLGQRMELWECKSKLLGIDNGANYSYSCTTELPVGFGYPGSLLLSIYGIISNGGYYSGFTSQELDLFGFTSLISTSLSLDQPVITGTDSIYSDGGTLAIYGRSLSSGSISDRVFIQYSDDPDNQQFEETSIISKSSSTLVINVSATTKSFKIKYVGLNDIESNEFIVTPIYFNFVKTTPSPTPSPTVTISPTLSLTPTPTPTNSPPKCQGNPECGGSDKGTCTSSGSCQCISPWTGITCQDRVIVIPKPEPNPNNPSNNLTLPGSTVGEISILSIRELNFNHVVIKTHPLNQWKLIKLDENRNQYTINITSGSSTSSTQVNTTITVITEWFDKLETITFANQELVMNPSTLKYNINITSYSFENTLNSLQLVIQSKAINNQDSGCSSQSYGDSVNDDSNYVQLSVDQHSLYGRFIKRGIIDNKLVVIENKQLNDFKTESNYHQTESYMGISIPYYSDVVQLDPDFSLLLNMNSADSICKNKSSLSKGALIGIVIGSVAAAAIITVVAIFLIKYKYQIRNYKPSIILKNFKNK